MEVFDASTSDSVTDPTNVEVEHWLGVGASDNIDSMCVDTAFTPDTSSVKDSTEIAVTSLHLDRKDVNACDTEMAPVANVNPYPPLNPYPQYIFPPAPSCPTSLPPSGPTSLPPTGPDTSLPLPTNQPITDLDEPDYNAPAEDEDADFLYF